MRAIGIWGYKRAGRVKYGAWEGQAALVRKMTLNEGRYAWDCLWNWAVIEDWG